jgi:hypothetical protein
MILRSIGRFFVSVANLAEAEGRALKRNIVHVAEREGRALRRNVEEVIETQRDSLRKHIAGLVLTCCLLAAAVGLMFLGTLVILGGLYMALNEPLEPAYAALMTGALAMLVGLLGLMFLQNKVNRIE